MGKSLRLTQNILLQQQLSDLQGWLSLDEGLLLYRLARCKKDKEAIVEIGSFQGKSTIYMALALKENHGSSKIFAIDPHIGEVKSGHKEFWATYKSFIGNLRLFNVSDYVRPIRQTSEDANRNWNKPISLLFIDGLHEYNNVKQDLLLWVPYVTHDGIVACHDAFSPFPDVFRAVREEIFARGNIRFIGFENSILYALLGKPSITEKILLEYSKIIITVTSNFWHTNLLPETVKMFCVNRLRKLLKPNYLYGCRIV